jgi:hypothetical protein
MSSKYDGKQEIPIEEMERALGRALSADEQRGLMLLRRRPLPPS